jgi:uncharacterized protein YcbK (DUF882 family)
MSKRIVSAMLAILAAMAMTVSGAQARVDNGSSGNYSQSASKSSKSYSSKKSYTSKKSYASKKFSKRTASSSKSKKRYSTAAKSKKRYASSGKKRLAKRSFVAYASGGASRSCLQPSARALLNRIEAKFGAVQIVSTCRAGATIATTGKPSKHRFGLAIDFSAGGRKGAIVQWLIANHHSGGTMTYRDMAHIHVDVGPRFVSLGAHSGKG